MNDPDRARAARRDPSRTQARRSSSIRLFLCLASAALLSAPEESAGQRTLTLEQSIDLAVQNSYIARNARARLRASEAASEAARLALYSSVDLEFDVPNYTRSLVPQFNPLTNKTEYFPIESRQWSGRLSINQPVIWTNTTLTLSGIVSRRDQQGTQSAGSFATDYYGNVAIMLQQPILVPNSQRIALRRAEIDEEESRAEYRRASLDLVYTVTESFYRAFSAQERLRIQQDRVRQQDDSYTTAMRKFKAGMIAEVEALQFEVDLASARNDALVAEDDFTSRVNSFNHTVGIPLNDSTRFVLADTTFAPVAVDLATAIAQAKRTRSDLQRAKNDVERSELSLDEVSGRRSIHANLTASYGLSNNRDQFSQLYTDIRETRGAVLTVTLPVFDWGRHSRDVEGATAQLLSAELTRDNVELTIEQEISDLVRRISSTAQRVDVLYKSRMVAEKANEISVKRYEVGTIGSIDLQQAQSRLLQARLSALEALIDYTISLADLRRRTAYDFVRGAEIPAP